jgi:hypothetical protein
LRLGSTCKYELAFLVTLLKPTNDEVRVEVFYDLINAAVVVVDTFDRESEWLVEPCRVAVATATNVAVWVTRD